MSEPKPIPDKMDVRTLLSQLPAKVVVHLQLCVISNQLSHDVMDRRTKRIDTEENKSSDVTIPDVMDVLDTYFPTGPDPRLKPLHDGYQKNRPFVEALVGKFFPEQSPGKGSNRIIDFAEAIQPSK